jgi:hypothetical protein
MVESEAGAFDLEAGGGVIPGGLDEVRDVPIPGLPRTLLQPAGRVTLLCRMLTWELSAPPSHICRKFAGTLLRITIRFSGGTSSKAKRLNGGYSSVGPM